MVYVNVAGSIVSFAALGFAIFFALSPIASFAPTLLTPKIGKIEGILLSPTNRFIFKLSRFRVVCIFISISIAYLTSGVLALLSFWNIGSVATILKAATGMTITVSIMSICLVVWLAHLSFKSTAAMAAREYLLYLLKTSLDETPMDEDEKITETKLYAESEVSHLIEMIEYVYNKYSNRQT